MSDFRSAMSRFFIKGTDRLDSEYVEDVREFLRGVGSGELVGVEDHRAYLEELAKFRCEIERYTKANGDRFLETIRSMLSVGEDGIYSNKLRFLFELIQNVDDCDYANISDCSLSVKFLFSGSCMVLEYNEVGFRPENVFAITGIAERSKNVEQDRREIGEKGLGFKSVFGVARKVLIQSGYFSFEIEREHFTIPKPSYDSEYEPVEGTRLTIFFDDTTALRQICDEVFKRYSSHDAVFKQNPILFLNKLTRLDIVCEDSAQLSFDVERKRPEILNERSNRCVERDVRLCVRERPGSRGGNDKDISIVGTRYSMDVLYDREACMSRYGRDTRLQNKLLNVQAFFPRPSDVVDEEGRRMLGNGVLYSFLPTQVKLTVPLICHAPFKLDASREFVDPEGANKWFTSTQRWLAIFLRLCFKDMAKTAREQALLYLPKMGTSLFDQDPPDKVAALRSESFSAKSFLENEDNGDLFWTQAGLKRHKEVYTLSYRQIPQECARDVHDLLGIKKELFMLPRGVSATDFGVETKSNVCGLLLQALFSRPESATLSCSLLAQAVDFQIVQELTRNVGRSLTLSIPSIRALLGHRKLFTPLAQHLVARAKCRTTGPEMLLGPANFESLARIDPEIGAWTLSTFAAQYFTRIHERCVFVNCEGVEPCCFPLDNACVFLGTRPKEALASFCGDLDKGNLFSAKMAFVSASRELNNAKTTLSPREYIKLLRGVRENVRDSLGKQAYANYVSLLNKSGVDTGRFLNELLQNADDCTFDAGVIPNLEMKGGRGLIEVAFNEVGFSNQNVRAITAIGESTKKLILESRHVIGEKGVGFKSLFSVASRVEIHSGGFHFRMEGDSPTIPEWIAGEDAPGTRILITFREGSPGVTLDEVQVLDLCLCLRRLRELVLFGHRVKIEDSDGGRSVTINGRVHVFDTHRYGFRITDRAALEDRRSGGRAIAAEQEVVCYFPRGYSRTSYPLYCGLPTRIRCRLPLIVDAPFDLTTSRDDVVISRWNEIVREAVYRAIVEIAVRFREKRRIDILALVGIRQKAGPGGKSEYVFQSFDGASFLNEEGKAVGLFREAEILPRLGTEDEFSSAASRELVRAPVFLQELLLKKDPEGANMIVDTVEVSMSREQVDGILDTLGCEEIGFGEALDIFSEHVGEEELLAGDFRSRFFNWLRPRMKQNAGFRSQLMKMRLVPVFRQDGSGSVEFVALDGRAVFTESGARRSTSQYLVLDTSMMQPEVFDDLFSCRVQEMNDAMRTSMYERMLKERLWALQSSPQKGFAFLLREYRSNGPEFGKVIRRILHELPNKALPLMNALGEVVQRPLFVCTVHEGEFFGKVVRRAQVAKEVADIALAAGYGCLEGVEFGNLHIVAPLEEGDIEDLQDGYFKNGSDILAVCMRRGLVPSELAERYSLGGCFKPDAEGHGLEFPQQRVVDRGQLIRYVMGLLAKPTRIIKKKVEQTIDACVLPNGREVAVDSKECRAGTLKRYEPAGHSEYCFCQMCEKPKRKEYAEVRNIQRRPANFWPELRLALCLECAKRFETLRNNRAFYERFIADLKTTPPDPSGITRITEGDIAFSFTSRHLAEIAEILKGEKAQ